MQLNTTTLIAKNLRSYAGKPLKPGQAFEAEDGHVKTLTTAPGGLAERPKDEQEKKTYRTRHMKAKDE